MQGGEGRLGMQVVPRIHRALRDGVPEQLDRAAAVAAHGRDLRAVVRGEAKELPPRQAGERLVNALGLGLLAPPSGKDAEHAFGVHVAWILRREPLHQGFRCGVLPEQLQRGATTVPKPCPEFCAAASPCSAPARYHRTARSTASRAASGCPCAWSSSAAS